MTDLLARLAAALADRYAIERELGAGGMATVYLAKDLKHEREVAVKVLRPELAASLGAERFLREIQIAAKLTHPHILPLYDSGEADGQLFYVMPYIEGESLRDRMDREGQLGVDDALQLVKEVGSALSHAHAMGLVHRDIKPENILLSGGHAVVADFGIARAVSAAGGEQLTETGLSVGTPHYMSPEQASGDKAIDGRSDEYALACVLYELLVGQPPFTGPTAMAVIARHTMDPVPSVRTVRNTIAVELEGALMKGLAKVPADRFATVQQFVEAVTGHGYTGTLPTPLGAGTAPRAWVKPVGIGVGAAVVVIALVVLARQLDFRALFAPAVEERIAVVDFDASITDPAVSYLGEAIPEFLSLVLTGEGGGPRALDRRVVTKAWRAVEGTTSDPVQRRVRVAERVGATHVVTGTVVQQGDSVRVTASLWQGREEVTQARVTAGREEASALAEQVGVQLLAAAAGQFERLSGLMPSSTEAVQFWLEGQRAYRDGRFRRAVELQGDALEVDSTFALAAWGMMKSAQWLENTGGWIDRGARLAWEHRDRLPHADSVIFNAEWHRNHISDDWLGERGSFELYREAVRQYPERWDAWLLYADYLWHEGGFHVDDGRSMAVAGFNRALALDSLGHSEPWQHLQEHYLMTRDAESYARLPEQHRSSYSDYVLAMQADTGLDAVVWAQFEGERIPYHIRGYRDAIARGQGREANAHLDSIFSQEAYQYVNHAVFDLQASGAGYEMADRLVGFLEERATAGDPNAATIAGIYWLNRGRPHRATPLLRIASQPPRLCGGRLCFLPVLWMQVGAFSGADPDEVGRIRDSLRVAHAVLDTVSYADLGPGEQAAFRHLLHERFWAVILDHVQGRTEDLEITARIALSAAEVVGDPRKQHEPGLISAFLDAVVLANADDPGALGAVQAADSALGMRMTLRSQMAWILILAQLYDRAGDAEKALAVIRRQGMVFGEEYVHLLPARLLQRARLAAELGLTDEATQAYNHYLTLRSDPEPGIEKQVAAVRAELAAVVGERQ